MVNISYSRDNVTYDVCLEQPHTENVWVSINGVVCHCLPMKDLEKNFDCCIGYAIEKFEVNKEIFGA